MADELEALDSAEDYRAAFELVGIGKFQIDPGTKRFTQVNAKLCELTGYSVDEFLTRPLLEITHPDDQKASDVALTEMIDQPGTASSLEKRYIRKDGTVIWVLENARVVRNQDGVPQKILAVVQDITSRKRTEEALSDARQQLTVYTQQLEQRVAERTARLEESIKALDVFCYGVAHDLRSPVRAVHGYTSMLKQQIAAQLDEQGRAHLERILSAAAHMDELIDGLLLYGRFGQLEMPTEPVSLDAVLTRVLEHLATEIRAASGRMDIRWPLPTVWGHAGTLEQIFANLISNALKFTRPDCPPKISIYAEDRETTSRIYVKDNGIGIAPEHQERIFRIFERLNSTNQYPGTGIGLAIVKKGVERLGGKVGLESSLGQGACFWLDLMKTAAG